MKADITHLERLANIVVRIARMEECSTARATMIMRGGDEWGHVPQGADTTPVLLVSKVAAHLM